MPAITTHQRRACQAQGRAQGFKSTLPDQRWSQPGTNCVLSLETGTDQISRTASRPGDEVNSRPTSAGTLSENQNPKSWGNWFPESFQRRSLVEKTQTVEEYLLGLRGKRGSTKGKRRTEEQTRAFSKLLAWKGRRVRWELPSKPDCQAAG